MKIENQKELLNKLQQDINSLNKKIEDKNENGVKNYIDNSIEDIKKYCTLDLEKLSTFIQEFINEQANLKIKQIKLIDCPATEKMNSFEWIVRNYEFISPNITTHLIIWCKEIIANPNPSPIKTSLTNTPHNSDVIDAKK